MAREKSNYRDMLMFLMQERGAEPLMNKSKAAKVMGISRNCLYDLIAANKIHADGNLVTVGTIARYLCD